MSPVCASGFQSDRLADRLIAGGWALLVLVVCILARPATAGPGDPVWLLQIDSAIGPATADYIERGIDEAEAASAQAIVLQINTEGGLDKSMRQINQRILSASIPIIAFVAPSGARAASAGTYILYACHLAAMAPATNLGAATPVQIGMPKLSEPPESGNENGNSSETGDDKSAKPEAGPGEQRRAEPQPRTRPGLSAMERKIINDAVAYIQGLAELRGRNGEWAERAVRQGVSLTASQALAQEVVEFVASDLDDLLQQVDGQSVQVGEREIRLTTEEVEIVRYEPDWRNEFLAVITNPNIAYLLFLAGIYGLFFEFSNPGLGAPGIIGTVCLLLALYAFQLLPVSYVGLGLLLLGVGLMVAEAMVPSFGVMGIGGVAAFIVGSIILMDTRLPGYQIALPIILAFALVSVGLLIVIAGLLFRSRHRPVTAGVESMVGSRATVEVVTPGKLQVRVHGELWRARCERPLSVGDTVQVQSVDGLVLVVQPGENL